MAANSAARMVHPDPLQLQGVSQKLIQLLHQLFPDRFQQRERLQMGPVALPMEELFAVLGLMGIAALCTAFGR